ncbi:hypothetical protein [Flavobacterium kingsejongi]|uniref:Uncharacterized protein n=1 Tax=Flavobacterium kingsejongi TaxID=1678728 RepID=A0A2S1LKC3_9FLAO|nr:hypothetical protein [Flavobacterium kingsejongi]AWG24195.1 hypothetical protein FK004_02635 [Flavobacterium kingsejongi]
MKKKLEADLISIAHRILQLKNKSDINQLYAETQKLYEKLTVLRFVDEHFGEVKPTIGYVEIEEKLEGIFETSENDKEEIVKEEEVADEIPVVPAEEESAIAETAPEPEAEEEAEVAEITEAEEEAPIETAAPEAEIAPETEAASEAIAEEEPVAEVAAEAETPEVAPVVHSLYDDEDEIEDEDEEEAIVGEETTEAAEALTEIASEEPAKEVNEFVPNFDLFEKEETTTETNLSEIKKQFTFDDIMMDVHPDPIFVRAEEIVVPPVQHEEFLENDRIEEDFIKNEEVIIPIPKVAYTPKSESKPLSLNDSIKKTITIGLNDRIAFEKYLFGGSGEDFNRVLSQLNTFDNFPDAYNFIEDLVKPDYNNWEGKEDYENRFMEIIEHKFS